MLGTYLLWGRKWILFYFDCFWVKRNMYSYWQRDCLIKLCVFLFRLLEIVSHRSFSLIQRSPLFYLLPIGRKHNQLVAYLHSVTENVSMYSSYSKICYWNLESFYMNARYLKIVWLPIENKESGKVGLSVLFTMFFPHKNTSATFYWDICQTLDIGWGTILYYLT